MELARGSDYHLVAGGKAIQIPGHFPRAAPLSGKGPDEPAAWGKCMACMLLEIMKVEGPVRRDAKLGRFDERRVSNVIGFPHFLQIEFPITVPWLIRRLALCGNHRLKENQSRTGLKEAAVCGTAAIEGMPVVLCVMDGKFIGGSMGSVVGEKVVRSVEDALEMGLPLIVVCASGGARMMEGVVSLMQMARTSAALARLDDAGGLFVSVLTDPTTGGVTASFAMLADVILAEPKARIGFAGPRVLKETIRADLPPGFQTAEFLMDRGFVDRVVPRGEMKSELVRIIRYCAPNLKPLRSKAPEPRDEGP